MENTNKRICDCFTKCYHAFVGNGKVGRESFDTFVNFLKELKLDGNTMDMWLGLACKELR